MIVRLLVAAFLVAHGLIHTGFVSPAPAPAANGPAWPFELGRSAVLTPLGLDPAVLRPLGIVLVVVVLGAFSLAALGILGVAPGGLATPALVTGAIASLALLVLYFHPWLVIGIAIDVVLLWLAFGDWNPESLGT